VSQGLPISWESPTAIALREEHPAPEDTVLGSCPGGQPARYEPPLLPPQPAALLYEPKWPAHLKEPAQEPLLRASAAAPSQHPQGAAGLQDFWRGQRSGKGDGREPEGFHVSSQSLLGQPWGCKRPQGTTWHISECREQEDIETQIFLRSTC